MKLKNPIPNAILKKYPNGNITQLFGENAKLYKERIGTNGHTGIDIATQEGDNIVAACNGKITGTYYNENLGGQVVNMLCDEELDTGDKLHLVYAHLKKNPPVKIGDTVKEGDIIGYESNTEFVISGGTPYWGNAPAGKGTHLHFGVFPYKKTGTNTWGVTRFSDNGFKGAVDPMSYLIEDYSFYYKIIEALKAKIEAIKRSFNK